MYAHGHTHLEVNHAVTQIESAVVFKLTKMYFGKLNVCRVTHTARKSINIKQDKIQQIKGYRGIISKCTDIHALLLCKQGEKY